jgi:hypothetical protein
MTIVNRVHYEDLLSEYNSLRNAAETQRKNEAERQRQEANSGVKF